MKTHFDIDRILLIRIYPEKRSHYSWLPRRQRRWFFGLFKKNDWQEEGFYSSGCYYEGYMGDNWEASPRTKIDLEKGGLLVKEDNTVWTKPSVTIYLEHEHSIYRSFETLEEAESWVEELKQTSTKVFEIVQN